MELEVLVDDWIVAGGELPVLRLGTRWAATLLAQPDDGGVTRQLPSSTCIRGVWLRPGEPGRHRFVGDVAVQERGGRAGVAA